MKKFISGVIVGALLFGGVSAFADSAGLLGKKVTGVFTIEKDGKKVADAAIINGSTYAPVRAVSQAVGVGLTVEGKKIIVGETTVKAGVEATTKGKTLAELLAERDKLAADIEKKKEHVSEFKKVQVDIWDVLISENPNSTNIPQWQNNKEKDTAELEKLKTDLADLQQQLTELDAQIAELQK